MVNSISCNSSDNYDEVNTQSIEKKSNLFARASSNEEFISLTKKFSGEFKNMLFYVTERAPSNDLEDVNNTINEYMLNNPDFVDSSTNIDYLTPDKLDFNYKLSDNLSKILNTEDEEVTINDLKDYISKLETADKLDEQEYISANIALSVVEYIYENENNRFGFYVDSSSKVKNRRRCAATIIVGAALGAGAGCIGGGESGLFAGPHGAATGCVVGAIIGGIGGALTAWGASSNCD